MNAEDVILEVSHLEKSFGSHDVLRDISFQVAKGDVVSVIGASGSGKSTMLRCVNLLETPTGGSILYHGEDITDPKINVPAYRSKVGMVFQSFNLFNNMTVLENCMVGQIKVAGRKKEEAEEKAMAYLRLTWTRTSMQNRVNFPVVRNSVWQLQGLWQWSRKSCFLTNRLPH